MFCTSNLLYNEKNLIGRLYRYFFINSETFSAPTIETLFFCALMICWFQNLEANLKKFPNSLTMLHTTAQAILCWLHFSDCMNNGGTSQLFIDFSPSGKGTKGQIVRFVHDPDEIEVIADSFDEYLQMLMDEEYDFINEDTVE